MSWLTAMEVDDESSTEDSVTLSSLSQEGSVPILMCLFVFVLRSGVKDRGVRNTTLLGVELSRWGEGGSE